MVDLPETGPIRVSPSSDGFSTWLSSPEISDNLRETLSNANSLIIPDIGYGGLSEEPLFPSGTEELFLLLSEKSEAGVVAGICIEDDDYVELALHSEIVYIAGLVVSILVFPVVIDVVGEFVKRRIWGNEEEATVRWNLTVVDDQNQRSLWVEYDGPASSFEESMQGVSQRLLGNDDLAWGGRVR